MITREINAYRMIHYTEGNNGTPSAGLIASITCLHNSEYQGTLNFYTTEPPLNKVSSDGDPELNFPKERLAGILDMLRNESPLFLGFFLQNNGNDDVIAGWLTTSEPSGDLT